MMAEAEIVSDPRVMLGKPCVAGTRITVELILEELAAGRSMKEMLEAHPRLTGEGIQAALGYALKVLRSDIIYPVVSQKS